MARAEAETGRNILELLMLHAPEVIVIADAPDARIRLISQSAEELIGRPKSEIIGALGPTHPFRQSLFESDGLTPMTFDRLPIVRAVKKGELVPNYEMALHRSDGGRLTVVSSAAPIRASDGRVTGGVSAWHDITARKHVEQSLQATMQIVSRLNRDLESRAVELQVANRELESFSYSISHDLRTPLTSVQNFASLVLQDCGDEIPPMRARYIELIRDNSMEMALMVEGLLKFSRFVRQPLNKQRWTWRNWRAKRSPTSVHSSKAVELKSSSVICQWSRPTRYCSSRCLPICCLTRSNSPGSAKLPASRLARGRPTMARRSISSRTMASVLTARRPTSCRRLSAAPFGGRVRGHGRGVGDRRAYHSPARRTRVAPRRKWVRARPFVSRWRHSSSPLPITRSAQFTGAHRPLGSVADDRLS